MLTDCSGVTWQEWGKMRKDGVWLGHVYRNQMRFNPRAQFRWRLSPAPPSLPGLPSFPLLPCRGLRLTPSPAGFGHRLVGSCPWDHPANSLSESLEDSAPPSDSGPRHPESSWPPLKWQSRRRPPAASWRGLTLWCCGVSLLFLFFFLLW